MQAAPVVKYWTEDAKGTRSTVGRRQLGTPLEALAEREPITTGPAAVRLRLESGAALLRRLAQSDAPSALLDRLGDAYRLTDLADDDLDPVGNARLRLLARHSLDADAVLDAIASAGGDAAAPPLASLPDRARTAAARVVGGWQRNEAVMFSEIDAGEPSAWSARRLEYRFGVTAVAPGGGAIELEAPEYPGGRLDWHHFDVTTFPEPPKPASNNRAATSIRVLPIPLQFAGMPASRWWEFEDGDAYFGDLAGGPDDLARSVVAAYSTSAGDDWFMVPCTLAPGSVAKSCASACSTTSGSARRCGRPSPSTRLRASVPGGGSSCTATRHRRAGTHRCCSYLRWSTPCSRAAPSRPSSSAATRWQTWPGPSSAMSRPWWDAPSTATPARVPNHSRPSKTTPGATSSLPMCPTTGSRWCRYG